VLFLRNKRRNPESYFPVTVPLTSPPPAFFVFGWVTSSSLPWKVQLVKRGIRKSRYYHVDEYTLGHVIANLLVSMTSFRFEPVRYIQSGTCMLLPLCEVASLQHSNALFSVCETRIFTVWERYHRREVIHVDIQRPREPRLCNPLLGTYDITKVTFWRTYLLSFSYVHNYASYSQYVSRTKW
jgi:hypothetical protein